MTSCYILKRKRVRTDLKNKFLFYRLRDGELVDVNQGRIEGGNTEQTALLIKEASRDDIGSYTCELKNDYGIGLSENDIDVDVHCKYHKSIGFYQFFFLFDLFHY